MMWKLSDSGWLVALAVGLSMSICRGDDMKEEHQRPEGIQWGNPLCASFVTVYEWDDRKLISDAPALVKLSDGTLLCSVELWSRDGFKGPDQLAEKLYGRNRCLILGSTDGGATWRERSRIPFATGKFLLHEEKLYFIGSGLEWEGLYITHSTDGGQTWGDLRFNSG
mgnify:FL=1